MNHGSQSKASMRLLTTDQLLFHMTYHFDSICRGWLLWSIQHPGARHQSGRVHVDWPHGWGEEFWPRCQCGPVHRLLQVVSVNTASCIKEMSSRLHFSFTDIISNVLITICNIIHSYNDRCSGSDQDNCARVVDMIIHLQFNSIHCSLV